MPNIRHRNSASLPHLQNLQKPSEMEAVLDVEALRANLRADGRKKSEIRSLQMEKKSTYRADGSATVSQGMFLERLVSNLKAIPWWLLRFMPPSELIPIMSSFQTML